MTVHSLEEDIQFVQQFQGYVVQIIATVKAWESIDASAIERAREDGNPNEVCYDEDEAPKIRKYKATYGELRTNINFEQVRVRNIATRYQLVLNENWIFNIPTQRKGSPDNYAFTFDTGTESAIIREIQILRGALSNDLREARRLESRPLWRKLWADYILQAAKWFIKPEHSKYTAIAILLILVASVLWCLGYDAKGIVEIIKAFKASAK